MALVPDTSLTSATDCSSFTVKDETVYGGGEFLRNEVTVDFVITKHTSESSTDITPSYDPATVTELVISGEPDGYYEVLMTITQIAPPNTTDSVTEKYLVMCSSHRCRIEETRDMVKESECGCEDGKQFRKTREIDLLITLAEDAVEVSADMDGAQRYVERIQELCNCDNCGCQ